MASSNKKPKLSSVVEEHLLCPVCLTIPRSGPVRQCQRGHIVCRECYDKIKVTDSVLDEDEEGLGLKKCPTCREPIRDDAFSLIAGNNAI